MVRARAVCYAAVLVSGCVGTPAVQLPPGNLAACGADRLIGMIGRPVADLPGQPANRTVRIIRPGDAVTEDFSAYRLNVILDGGDRVTALSCG